VSVKVMMRQFVPTQIPDDPRAILSAQWTSESKLKLKNDSKDL